MPESKEQKMGMSKLTGFWAIGFHQVSCYCRGKDLKRGIHSPQWNEYRISKQGWISKLGIPGRDPEFGCGKSRA